MKFSLWPHPLYVAQLLWALGAWGHDGAPAPATQEGLEQGCEAESLLALYALPPKEQLQVDAFYGIIGSDGVFRISIYEGPGWRSGTYIFYDPITKQKRAWRAAEIRYFKALGPNVRVPADASVVRYDNWREQRSARTLISSKNIRIRGARNLKDDARKILKLFEEFDRWFFVQTAIPRPRETLIILKNDTQVGAAAWPLVRRRFFFFLRNDDPTRQAILLTRRSGPLAETELTEPTRALHERVHTLMLSYFKPDAYLRNNVFMHEVFADFFVCWHQGCPRIGRSTSGDFLRNIESRSYGSEVIEHVFNVLDTDDLQRSLFSPHRASLLLNSSLWSLANQMPEGDLRDFIRLYLEQLNERRPAFLASMQSRGVPLAYLNDDGDQIGMALLDLQYAFAVAIRLLRSRPEWHGYSGVMQAGVMSTGLGENDIEALLGTLIP